MEYTTCLNRPILFFIWPQLVHLLVWSIYTYLTTIYFIQP